MAKFKINGNTSAERKVEADTYGQVDGYFHFTDEAKQRVLTLMATQVFSIERLKD